MEHIFEPDVLGLIKIINLSCMNHIFHTDMPLFKSCSFLPLIFFQTLLITKAKLSFFDLPKTIGKLRYLVWLDIVFTLIFNRINYLSVMSLPFTKVFCSSSMISCRICLIMLNIVFVITFITTLQRLIVFVFLLWFAFL